ncbi:MAG: hypothetical protein H0U92_05435 [Actinobacteria bacterium]|nr:hypothetical protein [Actinomycetota bacterium]
MLLVAIATMLFVVGFGLHAVGWYGAYVASAAAFVVAASAGSLPLIFLSRDIARRTGRDWAQVSRRLNTISALTEARRTLAAR